MTLDSKRASRAAALALLAAAGVALGQGSTVDEIAKYRQALQEGNPAELWEAHIRQKRELAVFARGRLRTQFARWCGGITGTDADGSS